MWLLSFDVSGALLWFHMAFNQTGVHKAFVLLLGWLKYSI